MAKTETATPRTSGKVIFESWRCEVVKKIENGKAVYRAEKLKKLRDEVKITEYHAHICNHDKVNELNTFVELFFKPGEETYFLLEGEVAY